MPIGLKVFLTALAIADDLGAVLVIALFYTAQIHWVPLMVAGGLLALMWAANLLHSRRVVIFLFLALAVWFADYLSGVHATVAGILVALVVPVKARTDPRAAVDGAIEQLRHVKAMNPTRESVIGNEDQFFALEAQYDQLRDTLPPGLVLEHQLHPFVAFIVLPLFALTNAGVQFGAETALSVFDPVSIGIVLGLLIGKPLGILLFSWLAVEERARGPAGRCVMGSGSRRRHLGRHWLHHGAIYQRAGVPRSRIAQCRKAGDSGGLHRCRYRRLSLPTLYLGATGNVSLATHYPKLAKPRSSQKPGLKSTVGWVGAANPTV